MHPDDRRLARDAPRARDERTVTVSLADLAQSLGEPYDQVVGLGLGGGLLLTPTAQCLDVRFALHASAPERLAQRGSVGDVLEDVGVALSGAALRRATHEAQRLQLPLAANWQLQGRLAQVAVRRHLAAARAADQARAARIRADAEAARRAKAEATAKAASPPLSEAEQEAALVASIVGSYRKHSGGPSGAPAPTP